MQPKLSSGGEQVTMNKATCAHARGWRPSSPIAPSSSQLRSKRSSRVKFRSVLLLLACVVIDRALRVDRTSKTPPPRDWFHRLRDRYANKSSKFEIGWHQPATARARAWRDQ